MLITLKEEPRIFKSGLPVFVVSHISILPDFFLGREFLNTSRLFFFSAPFGKKMVSGVRCLVRCLGIDKEYLKFFLKIKKKAVEC